MEQIIIGSVISFLVALYAVPVVLRISGEKSLFDIPDERKIHKSPIPSLGGIAIFIGFITGFLLSVMPQKDGAYTQYYTLAFLLLFFIGMKDDLVSISPLKKSIGQVIAACILVFKANLVITNLHGFLGIYSNIEITAAYALTIFAILVIVNAFNLIDGVDGLAGCLGMISCIIFGIYFAINNDIVHATLAIATASSLMAFLIYNFQPARIFMGDTGSMLIGIVNAILVIRFIEKGSSFPYPITATPAVGFSILMIPLMDTLRVFAIRMFNRRSPFYPDRNHLHHILLEWGFSHRAIAITLSLASVGFAVLGFCVQSWNCTLGLLLMITIFLVIMAVLIIKTPGRKLFAIESSESKAIEEKKPVNEVSLVGEEE